MTDETLIRFLEGRGYQKAIRAAAWLRIQLDGKRAAMGSTAYADYSYARRMAEEEVGRGVECV